MTDRAATLGIDFGTSTTVAMLTGADGVVRPLLFDASPLLSSAVFAGPGGALLTGADAERAALAEPAGFEPNPKRRIDEHTLLLGEREVTVADLVAAVLRRVAEEARRSGPVGEVVLTHPASWGPPRLAVLTEAAARAGLEGVRFVPEPIAAAVYFTRVAALAVPPGRCVVVYDLGAGTFDVSAVRNTGGTFEVVAASGRDDVGGLDLDAAVVGLARTATGPAGADAWARLDRPRDRPDQEARHHLWRGARAVKEQLSRHTTGDLRVPLAETTMHLTRPEFEAAALPLLERTVQVTLVMLTAARIDPAQVAGVVLVGGGSRVPLAATLLHRALRIPPAIMEQPELVVAAGSVLAVSAPGVPVSLPTAPFAPVSGAPVSPAATVTAPAARPATAQLPALRTVVSQRPPGPPGPPGGSALARPIVILPPRRPRRRLLVAGVAALLALVAAAAVVLAWAPWRADEPGPVLGAAHAFDLKGDQDAIYAVAFSPDGRTLVSGGSDDTLRRWNLDGRRAEGQAWTGHTAAVTDIRFGPDGKTLLSVGGDGARLWSFPGGAEAADALRPASSYGSDFIDNGVYGAGFTPGGDPLAVGVGAPSRGATAADRQFRLWNLRAGGAGNPLDLGTSRGSGGIWVRAAFRPAADRLAIGVNRTVTMFTVDGRQRYSKPMSTVEVRQLRFSPDGHVLAVAGLDAVKARPTPTRTPGAGPSAEPARDANVITFWDAETGVEVDGSRLVGHTDTITALAYSPDGRTLATASAADGVFLWDPGAHRRVAVLAGLTGRANSVAFSPDGTLLAVGTTNGLIQVYTLQR